MGKLFNFSIREYYYLLADEVATFISKFTSRLNRVFNLGNMEDLDFSKMCSLKNGFILSSPHLDFIKSGFFYYRNVKSFHEIGSKNQT
jgi:hypothetical protein